VTGLSTLYGRQPVLVLAFVQASLAMLMGFGLHLTGDQVALVLAFTAALLGILTQTQVTPMATLPDHVAAAVVAAANANVVPKITIDAPTGTEKGRGM
jgi:xanthosine utilization system XapX-like protein